MKFPIGYDLGGIDLKVRFYGVRGSTPSPGCAYQRYGGNTSCVVVTNDGEDPITLDAGTGLRAWGDTLPSTPAFRASSLVTHLHLDHIQGLPFFAPAQRPGARLDIYGPVQEIGSLEKAMTRIFRPPIHPVRPAQLHGEFCFHEVFNDEFVLGSAAITSREVPHLGPTVGYRIEHGGASVAYISDHQAPRDLQGIADGVLELASHVDLLIHDSQYTPLDWETKAHWGHCTIAYALMVAREAKARTLAMFHHDPCRDDEAIDLLLAEAQHSLADVRDCDVIAAHEGMTIEL